MLGVAEPDKMLDDVQS